MTSPSRDLCHTSIRFLSERCLHWFSRRKIEGPVWFADHDHPYPRSAPGETVHTVLFGGFLRRFLQSAEWRSDRHKLWVISEASRQTLCEVMGLPSPAIGLIPRYELMPLLKTPRPFPSWSEPFTLIFAGRLSPVKNLEFLLWSVWYLQNEWSVPVGLELIGDFDNQPHAQAGRSATVSYEHKIRSLIAKLEWLRPPVVRAKQGVEEWTDLGFERPVFVNFSTFISEDFDVSLAQAQSLGWPAWISHWGGHRDAEGSNLLKVAPHDIAWSFETAPSVSRKARAYITKLMQGAPAVSFFEAHRRGRLPHALERRELAKLRGRLIHEIGPEALLLAEKGVHAFAETEAGRKFLERYSRSFSGARL